MPSQALAQLPLHVAWMAVAAPREELIWQLI